MKAKEYFLDEIGTEDMPDKYRPLTLAMARALDDAIYVWNRIYELQRIYQNSMDIVYAEAKKIGSRNISENFYPWDLHDPDDRAPDILEIRADIGRVTWSISREMEED